MRITKFDYYKKLKKLKEKQYDLNIQKEEHTKADENYYITSSTVLNLAKRAKELFESSEITKKKDNFELSTSELRIRRKKARVFLAFSV